MTKKIIDGVLMDMTAEEIAQRETEKQEAIAEQQTIETAKAEHDALKASAKAKLIAGEALTEDEANTIVL